VEETLRQHPSNCLKICLFGPESSGKSTLSRKLSQHYDAPLVPEYAREYLQNLWNSEQKICRPKDLLPIATGQMKLENNAAKEADKLLICDTDLLTTKVYSEAYYNGWSPNALNKYALENTYDLYILTYIDTPWQKDDLRDRPEQREQMFAYFKAALERYNRPYILAKGTVRERLAIATHHINTLLI
jgi:NadR type nicotinamide-nucleotide adenylyltransferase